MLLEIFKYLRTPCPAPLREMGYLKELIGLEARAHRCLQDWLPHLIASRELITEAARLCQNRRRAVVLGSGGLLDIPLAELAEMFEEVVLVDVLHLPSVRKAIAEFDNVTLMEHDVAQVIAPLYSQVRDSTPLPLPEADLPIAGADFVVSANVVSQLPVIPVEYAARAGKHSTAGLSVLSKTLIESHLAALMAFQGDVCLITEVEHQILSGEEILTRYDPLHGVVVPAQLGTSRRFWDWNFAPRPERYKDRDVRYQIEGFMRPAIRET